MQLTSLIPTKASAIWSPKCLLYTQAHVLLQFTFVIIWTPKSEVSWWVLDECGGQLASQIIFSASMLWPSLHCPTITLFQFQYNKSAWQVNHLAHWLWGNCKATVSHLTLAKWHSFHSSARVFFFSLNLGKVLIHCMVIWHSLPSLTFLFHSA